MDLVCLCHRRRVTPERSGQRVLLLTAVTQALAGLLTVKLSTVRELPSILRHGRGGCGRRRGRLRDYRHDDDGSRSAR